MAPSFLCHELHEFGEWGAGDGAVDDGLKMPVCGDGCSMLCPYLGWA